MRKNIVFGMAVAGVSLFIETILFGEAWTINKIGIDFIIGATASWLVRRYKKMV